MKKIMLQYIRYCLFIISVGVVLISCGDMDEMHLEYLKDGEIIYSGKPDSLRASSGNTRIKLDFYLISDPKITKVKIFWNNPEQFEAEPQPGERIAGRDSVEIPIERSSGIDHIETIIANLKEGVYTFEVFTYDKDGNSSIRSEVIGDVYGETYQNSISNRPLDNATYYANTGDLGLKWFGAAQQSVIVEVIYTDKTDVQRVVAISKVYVDPRKPPVFLDTDNLPNLKPGTGFKYRTGFLPNVAAIDTFYTDYKIVDDLEVGFKLPDYFKVIAKHSGKALSIESASTGNGGLVVQTTFNPSAESIWKLSKNAEEYVVFTNVNSDRDMAVQSASEDDGATILQWSQGSNTNDEWTLERIDDTNYHRIVNRKSGKVVEVADGSIDEGAGVQQNAWNGSDYQQFEIMVVKSSEPPAEPGSLNATAISSSQIDLSWSDNSDNEYRFRIERSSDGSNWSSLATVGANTTSYSDSGLPASTPYFYRVRAENTAGNSSYSNTADATTLVIAVGVGITEAESLILQDFQIENNYQGEDAVAKPVSKDIVGSISGTFTGSNGTYNISVRYFDEDDGQATIELKVNGVSQGTVTADADDNTWHTWMAAGVNLNEGDEVKVEASQNDGEHCRIDKIIVE